MKRVTGIGGVFFKADDPAGLNAWYGKHLGIEQQPDGSAIFEWREKDDPKKTGLTVWSTFPKDTTYFDPSPAPFMINFRVADLNALLQQLKAEGVQVDNHTEEYEYGRFGWIMDPEGN